MRGRNKQYTDEELLNHLREYAEELGHTPTKRELDAEDGRPCESTYRRRFGSLRSAHKEAGLETSPHGNPAGSKKKYTKEELINKLQKLAEEVGDTPISTQMRESEITPPANRYRAYFDSLREAQRQAGLEPNPRGHREEDYTDEELIGWIVTWHHNFGCMPTAPDFADTTSPTPAPGTYVNRFGSFQAAIEKAEQEVLEDD